MAGEAFSHSYYVLSMISYDIHKKVLGVCDEPCLNYALRPKDLSHQVLEYLGICLR
jgi:hypothetical protein